MTIFVSSGLTEGELVVRARPEYNGRIGYIFEKIKPGEILFGRPYEFYSDLGIGDHDVDLEDIEDGDRQ